MKRTNVYEAEDGTRFATVAECKSHEEKQFMDIFVGLSTASVMEAFNRKDVKLADAFERAGNVIGAKRRESGELKRAKKEEPRGTTIGTGSGVPTPKPATDKEMDKIKKNMKAIS
jgi:hypothetical protein